MPKKKEAKAIRFPDPQSIKPGPKMGEAEWLDHMHTHDLSDISWRIFKIMSEFVDGFELLSTTQKEVTIYGSTHLENSKYYEEVRKLAKMLGEDGFTIITGGGPGIMEAGNRGAAEAGATSIGLNIQLPREQHANKYANVVQPFHYFFTRKVVLAASAQAYIFGPGGFGTMDEFFEILTLIQTKKMQRVPVVCLFKDFWDPIVENIIKGHFRDNFGTVNKGDEDIITVVDTAEEAFEIISQTSERSLF